MLEMSSRDSGDGHATHRATIPQYRRTEPEAFLSVRPKAPRDNLPVTAPGQAGQARPEAPGRMAISAVAEGTSRMIRINGLVAGGSLGEDDLDVARQVRGKASGTPLSQGAHSAAIRHRKSARF